MRFLFMPISALIERLRFPPVEKVVGQFSKTVQKLERVAAHHANKKVQAEAAAVAMQRAAVAHDNERAYADAVKANLHALINPVPAPTPTPTVAPKE